MDDPILQEIKSRKYVIMAPERSSSRQFILILGTAFFMVLSVVILGLFVYFALGGNTVRNASVAQIQPLQGTPIVLVGNWPQDRPPTATAAPTATATVSALQQTVIADATKMAQPTPDPKWQMPFCNDSTTLPLTPCLPYAVTTPTPAPTPTPMAICTEKDFKQDASNIHPCLKSPHASPIVTGASPTPTFAVPTAVIPSEQTAAGINGPRSGSMINPQLLGH